MRHFPRLVFLLLTACLAPAQLLTADPINVWTFHYDNARSGANTNETLLAPANVNTNTFGKLFSHALDGYVYAQPLYLTNITIAGKGTHNVVFVATEHDSVYAFDADSNTNANASALWQRTLLGANQTTLGTNDVGTTDVTPEIGITGTPVIDVAAGTLFVVAKMKQVSGGVTTYLQQLHALDITSGLDRPNSPVTLQFSVPGTGDGTDGTGNVPFNPLKQHQRSSLLLLNGVVYVAWASHGDLGLYHGWLVGYDEQTLQQLAVFNTTPNGGKGGIWMANGAPAADESGNIFLMTGNGTYDASSDYGDSILRLTTTNLVVADSFTPFNQATLSTNDTDLGSGGALLLPDYVGSTAHQHLLVGAGKGGTIYLVDRLNMGGYNTANDNAIVQHLTNAVGVNLSTPAFFNGRIYYMAYNDFVKAYSIANASITAPPFSQSTLKSGIFGASPTISANGTNNAIVWILLTDQYKTGAPGVLHAFNAYDLTQEYYNTSQAGTRDQSPGAVKFTLPTVVNGKLYIAGQSNLAVYGNAVFTTLPFFTAQPQSQTVLAGTNLTMNIGAIASNGFTCRWFFNGVVIPGATSTNYLINNVQITNAGRYFAVVSNSFGTNLSSTAFLSVIAPLTNAPGSILAPANLVNWWPADGNTLDIFGPNNGIPEGNLSFAPGESGLAFNFDGNTAYIGVNASNLLPPWTACMWVNRQNSLTNAAIMMAGNTYSLKLEQYNTAREVGITQLSVEDYTFSSGYAVPLGTWTHLAFVANTTSVSLYANGTAQGSITVNNFPLPRTYIGVGSTGTRFIDPMFGRLDDIMVFNRALGATEINAIHSAGAAGLVRAPQFSAVMQTNSQLNLTLKGQTGKTFTIYSSSNLVTWQSVITLPNPTGMTQYADPAIITNNTAKFYRATQP